MTQVLEQMNHPGNGAAPHPDALTPREREILKHIAQGETNPQIAAALSLSVKTVEWHRSNLMNKLGVHSVAQLVRYAMENKLLIEGVEKD